MEIAPGYTVADWKKLNLDDPNSPGWKKAICIFEARIRRRFIEPVDVLIAHEIGLERGAFGFAILAIDCLLVETFQGFREGVVDHTRKSKALFRTFLSTQLSRFFDDGRKDGSKADRFYKACRCGIHHSGQTDGNFLVRKSGSLIAFRSDGVVVVNRTAFHDEIKRELDAYLLELANSSNSELRKNFRTKMNAICGIEIAAENGTGT